SPRTPTQGPLMPISRRHLHTAMLSLAAAVASPSAFAQPMENEDMLTITPFTIDISDAEIADLKDRLGRTRFPAAITEDWSRGQPLSLVKDLRDQWLHVTTGGSMRRSSTAI